MTDLVIFSDESGSNGPRYSNFYGGALVRSTDVDHVVQSLQSAKRDLNLYAELKWTKLSPQYLDRYLEMTDRFLDFVREDKVKIRIMFTDNRFRYPHEHRDTRYTKLYYQFIKHAFGLRYFEEWTGPTRVLLRPDQLPVRQRSRLIFKEYLAALSKHPDFRQRGLILPIEEIREADSKQEVVLRLLDIVLGAMWFRLNGFQKLKPVGEKHRSAKTLAKNRLYRRINERVREIYPGFNVGITTGKLVPSDYWSHSYRHWKFVAYDSELTEGEESALE